MSNPKEIDKKTRKLASQDPRPGQEFHQFSQGQNTILGINQEQENLLREQMIQQQAAAGQNQILAQAGEMGIQAAMGEDSQALAAQMSRMQPQTQATLAKYGVKQGAPKVQRQSGRSVQVQPNKVTVNNTTYTTIHNDTKITQPAAPSAPVVVPAARGGGSAGTIAKFKTWMSNVFARQHEENVIRQKEYQRKEWSLSRSASRMMRGLEKLGKTFAERLDPRKLSGGKMSSMKMLSYMMTIQMVRQWWPEIIKAIGWVGDKVSQVAEFFGWSGGKWSWEESGLRKGLLRLLGSDPNDKETIPQALGRFFWNGTDVGKKGLFNVFLDKLKEFFNWDDRIKALNSIEMPEFKLPSSSFPGVDTLLGGIKNIFTNIAEYLKDIFSAIFLGKDFKVSRAARQVRTEQKEAATSDKNSQKVYNRKEWATFSDGEGGSKRREVGRGDMSSFIDKKVLSNVESDWDGNDLANNTGATFRHSAWLTDSIGLANEDKTYKFFAGMEKLIKAANKSGDQGIAVDESFVEKLAQKFGLTVSDYFTKKKIRFAVPSPESKLVAPQFRDIYDVDYNAFNPLTGTTGDALWNGAKATGNALNTIGSVIGSAYSVYDEYLGDRGDFIAVPGDYDGPGLRLDDQGNPVETEAYFITSAQMNKLQSDINNKIGVKEGEDNEWDITNNDLIKKYQTYNTNNFGYAGRKSEEVKNDGGDYYSLKQADIDKSNNLRSEIKKALGIENWEAEKDRNFNDKGSGAAGEVEDILDNAFSDSSGIQLDDSGNPIPLYTDPITGEELYTTKDLDKYIGTLVDEVRSYYAAPQKSSEYTLSNGIKLNLGNSLNKQTNEETLNQIQSQLDDEVKTATRSTTTLSESTQILSDSKNKKEEDKKGSGFSDSRAGASVDFIYETGSAALKKVSNLVTSAFNKFTGKDSEITVGEAEQKIRSSLKSDLGINDTAASGVLGNLYRESGLNPKEESQPDNQGRTAEGIAQWRGDRKNSLLEFHKSNGGNATKVTNVPLEDQVEFMINEAKGRKGLMRELSNIPNDHSNDSIVKAAEVWLRGYEFGGQELATREAINKASGGTYNDFMNKGAAYALDIDKKAAESAGYTSNADVSNAQYSGVEVNDDSSSTSSDNSNSQSAWGNYYKPTSKGTITSNFGRRNIIGGSSDHKGVDIGLEEGEEVYAIKPGTVTRVSFQDYQTDKNTAGYGNWVEVEHENGLKTRYAHLKEKPLVQEGDVVDAGQVLGYVGNTGTQAYHNGEKSGYHLHFETLQKNDKGEYEAVDPSKNLDKSFKKEGGYENLESGKELQAKGENKGWFSGLADSLGFGEGGIFSGLWNGVKGLFNKVKESFESLLEIDDPDKGWEEIPNPKEFLIDQFGEKKGSSFLQELINNKSTNRNVADALSAEDPNYEYRVEYDPQKRGVFKLFKKEKESGNATNEETSLEDLKSIEEKEINSEKEGRNFSGNLERGTKAEVSIPEEINPDQFNPWFSFRDKALKERASEVFSNKDESFKESLKDKTYPELVEILNEQDTEFEYKLEPKTDESGKTSYSYYRRKRPSPKDERIQIDQVNVPEAVSPTFDIDLEGKKEEKLIEAEEWSRVSNTEEQSKILQNLPGYQDWRKNLKESPNLEDMVSFANESDPYHEYKLERSSDDKLNLLMRKREENFINLPEIEVTADRLKKSAPGIEATVESPDKLKGLDETTKSDNWEVISDSTVQKTVNVLANSEDIGDSFSRELADSHGHNLAGILSKYDPKYDYQQDKVLGPDGDPVTVMKRKEKDSKETKQAISGFSEFKDLLMDSLGEMIGIKFADKIQDTSDGKFGMETPGGTSSDVAEKIIGGEDPKAKERDINKAGFSTLHNDLSSLRTITAKIGEVIVQKPSGNNIYTTNVTHTTQSSDSFTKNNR